MRDNRKSVSLGVLERRAAQRRPQNEERPTKNWRVVRALAERACRRSEQQKNRDHEYSGEQICGAASLLDYRSIEDLDIAIGVLRLGVVGIVVDRAIGHVNGRRRFLSVEAEVQVRAAEADR